VDASIVMAKRKLSPPAFIKKVRDAVKQYDMIRPGGKVLAAVSGGPDSVCLLKSLMEMRRDLDVEIVVGNLDHGIRGKESGEDSDFVRKLARDLGLDCAHRKMRVKTRRDRKKSLEECAREKRYKFLKEAAGKHGCDIIATGHTMDDQAETVLIRLITGASLKGMAGIPVVRYEGDLKIVRPLIGVEKKEVLDYLEAIRWEYCVDRTNKERKYLRNRIRHEVLPFLRNYNPKIKRALVNLSDTIREDVAFLEAEKKKVINGHPGTGKGPVKIRTGDLILQPGALRKEVFKHLFSMAGGNVKKLTYRHWRDMDYFLRAGEKGKSLDFPGGVRVTKVKDEIVFKKRR